MNNYGQKHVKEDKKKNEETRGLAGETHTLHQTRL